MSDYISRQAAIDKLKSEPIGRMIISKYNLDGWLEGLPSADVVEVVRCKDCKHRKKNTFCLHNMRYEQDSGFCSYGERKEG